MATVFDARIFGRRMVGDREEIRLKVFDSNGEGIDLSGSSSGGPDGLPAHINSSTPHPVYDDGPSLVLLYENAKV